MLESSVDISEPDPLVIILEGETNPSCYGGSDGLIDISVTGGTAPYSYVWSNGSAEQDAEGLSAGMYSVVVTDANGCIITSIEFELEDPDPIELTADVTDADCAGGSDGEVTLTASGGDGDYTYWISTDDPSNKDKELIQELSYNEVKSLVHDVINQFKKIKSEYDADASSQSNNK